MPQSTEHRQQRRRCLIIERHEWETGGKQQQLQFVLGVARRFFGSGGADRQITVRVYLPPNAASPAFERRITISREYANGTRRTNGFPEMGSVPSSFILFEEAGQSDVYNVWWQVDKPIVVARYRNTVWEQGRNTQHGRGRLSAIVAAPVARRIDSLS